MIQVSTNKNDQKKLINKKVCNKKENIVNINELNNNDELSKFNNFMDLRYLPDDLRISTITITCSFQTNFNVENIGKYMDMTPNKIVSVLYGDNEINHRSILILKKKPKKKKRVKKSFYNQVTLKIMSETKNKPVNVKLFRNGSIQMTGCKSIDDCISILRTLCIELKKKKAIIDITKEKQIELKPFVSSIDEVELNKVNNLKVVMINSNFNIGFKIERSSLYKILLNDGILSTFEPCVHACVNIKYQCENQDVISIFVFESGAIIITGAKNKTHIVQAYNFITKKLYDNYNQIVKNDIKDILQNINIMDMLNLKSN